MMSNSNYSIDLQRLKPVHTAYCSLHNLAENWVIIYINVATEL